MADSEIVNIAGENVTVEAAPGWKNWKTLAFGALLSVIGGVQATDLLVIIPPQYTGIAMTVIGGVVIWLRTLTAGPAMSNVRMKVN